PFYEIGHTEIYPGRWPLLNAPHPGRVHPFVLEVSWWAA
ncbi:MAG: hypothetical protein ACI957_004942, partial [Verrucomicrobiales bacterium]